jgi:hypothetical protein
MLIAREHRLARVIVAKPQSRQMFQMLVSKLGGLLNRRIYHMPFSRALTLSASQADIIGDIYQECMTNRGIMLIQPEHVLSFKLMGIECLLSGKPDIGRSLLRTQHFFDNKSRDIVDESDEIFSVKYELVYTMGEYNGRLIPAPLPAPAWKDSSGLACQDRLSGIQHYKFYADPIFRYPETNRAQPRKVDHNPLRSGIGNSIRR